MTWLFYRGDPCKYHLHSWAQQDYWDEVDMVYRSSRKMLQLRCSHLLHYHVQQP